MARYIQDFTKTVHGYFVVEADTPEEAEQKFDDADYDEFDNKSDYECGEWERISD
jgi:hypothetical protein